MNTRTHRALRRTLCPALLMTTTMLYGVPAAMAQEAATTLDEVVVTAQKRSENLQDVPISLQVFGQEKLEQLNLSDFDDYAKYLPSVSFQTFGPGVGSVYMRGVASGGDGNHSGSLPSVGVYLDEQPITTIQGALDIHIYDVARVEALAGPQGTLYGASSQAGTVRIITNKPDPSGFSAGVNLEVNTVAHGGEGYVAEGYFNQPISDNVAIRLVGWSKTDAGYIDNVLGSLTYPTSGIVDTNEDVAEDDYNQIDTYGARAALRIDLNDSWTITPSIMGQVQKATGFFGSDANVGDLAVTHFNPERTDDEWYQAALAIEGRIGSFDVTYAGAYMERTFESESDYSDYAFFYDTLFGYGAYFVDDAGDPVNPSQYIQGVDGFTKQSHEIRISSPQDRRLRFVGGLFYQKQTHDIFQDYKVNGIGDDISVPGYEDTIWLTKQMREDIDTAIFGEVAFDLTDQLSVTAGIRGFRSENSLYGFFGYSDGFSGTTGVAACDPTLPVLDGSPCTNLDKAIKEEDTVPKFNVTYKLDDNRLIYLTYSEGYRPGGINRRGSLPPYQSDYLKNYEFGWKTTLFDNRVRWNGAAYLQEWDNFQFSLLGQSGLTEIKNAGQAEVKGIETDITWAVSSGLTLTASAAYIDSKLTENFCGFVDAEGNPETDCPAPEAPEGSRLPITPEFKGNLIARYEWTVGSLAAHVQGSMVYQTSAPADLRTEPAAILGDIPSFTLVDFSAGLDSGIWSLEAYVKNAFDEEAQLSRFAQCAETVCGGVTYFIPTQPRTIGVRVGRRF